MVACGGAAQSPVPSSPAPTSTSTATPASTGALGIVIPVPTDAPVLCVPSPVNVTVGQTVRITCAAAYYIASFTLQVADPAIASVQQYNPENPTLFNVAGLAAGTTTLTLSYPPTGSGSVTIVVTP